MSPPRFPESTYRLQFHAGFTFREATKIIPYLHDLGITHIYASPILKARSGSTHGYDVVDPTMLNPELGTADEFAQFVESMKRHDMEQIVDIVPNHMGVGTNENPWWNDVLEKGPASRYAGWFDIAWRGSAQPELQDKVMLPVLGQPYRDALKKGEIRLIIEAGRFYASYYDRRFPIARETYSMIPNDENLAIFNGTPGNPRSFDLLDHLLDQQHYRLCYWREASDAINYRRFFDINDLAALCMEREDVFDASHALIRRLVKDGKIAGLRIDHPDGLLDPEAYFLRLQRRVAPPKADGSRWPLYVVAEKILAEYERLPENWDVQGTTGYDFINQINGLFVDPANAATFTQQYNEWAGSDLSFADICYQKKRLILESSLAGDFQMLVNQLDRLGIRRDLTVAQIAEALRETIACFPVYRSYISDRGVDEQSARHIESAIGAAIERNPKIDSGIFQFLTETLLLRYPESFTEEDRAAQRRFVEKFQQLTAPVTAKGIEDTAFYVFNRLVSLNEVGGNPGRFGLAPEALHQWLRERQSRWPNAQSPLSTHDTKRSEDVRARLNVLSEIPNEWWACVARWKRLNEPHRKRVDGKPAPDSNDECLLYQTLVGVWPLDSRAMGEDLVDRIQQYMRKAVREAKVHSSWTDPNADYEAGLDSFIATILSEDKSKAFLDDFRSFQARVSRLGLLNSLAQTVLRLTAPGVPDTYQGTELWDFSLVDPDNRRPVDYERREEMLRYLQSQIEEAGDDRTEFARELVAEMESGRAKLFVTWQALTCRRENPGLFTSGKYIPLEIVGAGREHAFGFLRELNGKSALIMVPRLVCGLLADRPGAQVWGDTRVLLPPGYEPLRFRDRFTGGELTTTIAEGACPAYRLSDVLRDFPVALLLSVQ